MKRWSSCYDLSAQMSMYLRFATGQLAGSRTTLEAEGRAPRWVSGSRRGTVTGVPMPGLGRAAREKLPSCPPPFWLLAAAILRTLEVERAPKTIPGRVAARLRHRLLSNGSRPDLLANRRGHAQCERCSESGRDLHRARSTMRAEVPSCGVAASTACMQSSTITTASWNMPRDRTGAMSEGGASQVNSEKKPFLSSALNRRFTDDVAAPTLPT